MTNTCPEWIEELLKKQYPRYNVKSWSSFIVDYAHDVIKGRWPEAEPIILTRPSSSYLYAQRIIKGRWPEAEPLIMKHPNFAYKYANWVIKGRWPEAEPIIMKYEAFTAMEYARDVIKGRWLEAESFIMAFNDDRNQYLKWFPDAQTHYEGTPVLIGDVIITDISNKTSSEQLKQLFYLMFYSNFEHHSERDINDFFADIFQDRIYCEQTIRSKTNSVNRISIDQIRSMSFEAFCNLFYTYPLSNTDFE